MNKKQKTHLANSIEVADAKSKMDENAKQLLANKQVLSWIFKHTVEEFRDCTYEEIEGCIEGEPEVGIHPVHPGKGNIEVITGMNTESKIPNEGEITFDVRCYAITKGEERVKLIINVEAQKSYYLTYPWILRGLFYCARMVSEQKDTEFRHDDYGDLKKVYSIWIFMESPEYAAHTISSYTITHNNLYGEYEEKERYDLMNVIAVRLALNGNLEGGGELHQMLETLFSSRLTVQEKEEKLEKEFGMRITEGVKKGADSMCNISDLIEEQATKRGLEKGMQQGLQQGMQQGMQQGLQQGENRLGKLISALLKDGLTEVVERVAVDEEVRAEYYKKYDIQ